jgi:hypothetical protein
MLNGRNASESGFPVLLRGRRRVKRGEEKFFGGNQRRNQKRPG